ncbi:FkbM family methyltransferase [Rhizobium laguerreae]|uniref:FkbM family methyltransferase n=1 Tax=Rhizobium laguerreae TaxID=1076926 RepID=UPI001C90E17F|nr:FkbM family methyltransferase [Rhizobium laguerreae]MBY3386414.1 FkbM family methyltransferase [Rhizobium laguerreae]
MDISYLKAGRNFATLIDIGANDGAYGAHLKELFGIKRVIAFEPLPKHRAGLLERGFEVHSVAVGDENGSSSLIVNHYDAASSLLPITDRTSSEWPEAKEAETITVDKVRLDDRLAGVELRGDLMIKVDAQGYESRIIDGGKAIFSRAKVVLIECIFVSLYKGDSTFNSIHAGLASCGLELTGFKNQNISKTDGRPLFAHCIYERL